MWLASRAECPFGPRGKGVHSRVSDSGLFHNSALRAACRIPSTNIEVTAYKSASHDKVDGHPGKVLERYMAACRCIMPPGSLRGNELSKEARKKTNDDRSTSHKGLNPISVPTKSGEEGTFSFGGATRSGRRDSDRYGRRSPD